MRMIAHSAFLAALLLAASTSAADDPEDELKAAVVLSFVRYTDWPANVGGTISIGIRGRPEFGQLLSRTLDGRTAGARHIKVFPLRTPADANGCQILYLASARTADVEDFLKAPQAAHALIIGEANHFLDDGGAIELMLVDGHMSFEVALPVVERLGLNISSKLLRFGQIRNASGGRMP